MMFQAGGQTAGSEGTAHVGIIPSFEIKTAQLTDLKFRALLQMQDQDIGAFGTHVSTDRSTQVPLVSGSRSPGFS